MSQDNSSPAPGSSAVQLVVYWAIVAIPLGWGVYKTVDKSKALFQGTNVTAASSPAPATAATPAASAAPMATATPSATPVPMPEASPFSTAQPSATVAPIDTPPVPKT